MRVPKLAQILILIWTGPRIQAAGQGSRDFTHFPHLLNEDDGSFTRGIVGASSSRTLADHDHIQHQDPANFGFGRYPVQGEGVPWHEGLPELPSDEDFFHSMISETPSVSGEASGVQGKKKWPWQHSEQPWVPVYRGLGQQKEFSHYVINPFIVDGREFGPLKIFADTFESKPYPHDLPFLEPINQQRQLQFKDFRKARDHHTGIFRTRQTIFRPDPQMLGVIEVKFKEILPQEEPASKGEAKQGEFLWPPVKFERGGAGLAMDREFRDKLFSVTRNHIVQHFITSDRVWRLPIATPQGTRNIMMHIVDPQQFTDQPARSQDSSLWVFYEAVHDGKRHLLALLGAMYLPKSIFEELVKGKIISRAWLNRAQ
ncbi:uncharacterized protein MEPE_02253 [Melanopsichium pennsylvanicum]|uniref:Uncharacterized protein n=2 Tax=Melanopsichium pennsylvanicum TaxID=63383 RepID=A0AAJ4XKN6_9BASI|nr:conserved hypothetical Ustilago-specific protein [Melanopsichium pennsylvanicum 4]SNX83546.1 uncharacterized protein MEPE_02253 [Melanopsichium pennsylvanicum]